MISERLMALDAHVIGIGREANQFPTSANPKFEGVMLDVGEWDKTYCEVLKLGPVHGLVNNAGVAHIEPLLETTQHGWDECVV